MTTNPEGAPGFYGEIAGWGTQLFEGGGVPYAMTPTSGLTVDGSPS